MKNKLNILKIILKTILLIISSALLGMLLLILIYAIPTNKIYKNAEESSKIFEKEGTYPEIINGIINTRLDNFTDGLIFGEIVFDNEESIINKSIYVYSNKKGIPDIPNKDFVDYINNNREGLEKGEYSRYWHGNLVFVKLLLLVFNYSQIRYINIFIQTTLLIYIIILMYKNNLEKHLFDFIVPILLICPFAIGMSLQFSSVYYITLISLIIMLKCNDKIKNNYIYYYLSIGILTSYLDLLTYPIFTLGMPLIFYLMLNSKKRTKEKILDILKFSLFWAIGYFGMWMSKWIIGSILCKDNLFTTAISSAKYRSSSDLGRINAILVNIKPYINIISTIITLPLISYYLFYIIKNYSKMTNSMVIREIPNIIIIIIPIVWYFIMSEHSTMHWWFTNKSLAVSIFSTLFLLNDLKKQLTTTIK